MWRYKMVGQTWVYWHSCLPSDRSIFRQKMDNMHMCLEEYSLLDQNSYLQHYNLECCMLHPTRKNCSGRDHSLHIFRALKNRQAVTSMKNRAGEQERERERYRGTDTGTGTRIYL